MYMSYYTMIQLDNEEMVTDAMVPAPLAAGLMYLLFTALREISSWSQGRLKEGEDGARPGRRGGGKGREPLLTTEMIKQVPGTPVYTSFLLSSLPFQFHSKHNIPFDK